MVDVLMKIFFEVLQCKKGNEDYHQCILILHALYRN